MKNLKEKLKELKNVKIIRKYSHNSIKAKEKEKYIIESLYNSCKCYLDSFVLYCYFDSSYEFIIYDSYIKITNGKTVLLYNIY